MATTMAKALGEYMDTVRANKNCLKHQSLKYAEDPPNLPPDDILASNEIYTKTSGHATFIYSKKDEDVAPLAAKNIITITYNSLGAAPPHLVLLETVGYFIESLDLSISDEKKWSVF
jgi:hypothetical protein